MAQARKAQVASLSKSESKLKTCEVHHSALKVENVPISYGLIGFPGGYWEARQRYFPHANSGVMGGCVISADSPTHRAVKLCPQCRIAEKRWGKVHNKSVSKR